MSPKKSKKRTRRLIVDPFRPFEGRLRILEPITPPTVIWLHPDEFARLQLMLRAPRAIPRTTEHQGS